MKVLTGSATILLLAGQALAGEAPTGFAEFPWGIPEASLIGPCTAPVDPAAIDFWKQMEAATESTNRMLEKAGQPLIPLPKRPRPTPPSRQKRPDGSVELLCHRAVEVAGGKWAPLLIFIEDKLAGYEIACARECYPALRRIAAGKFGTPHWITTAQYRLGNGLPADGEVSVWIWRDGTQAVLLERDGSLDRACLQVSTRGYLERASASDRE